ncbi:hypothetical protein D3C76_401310 [compost metagenome]
MHVLCFFSESGDRRCIQGIDVHIEATTWIEKVTTDKANQQRNGRNHFEVEQCFATYSTNLFQIAHSCDASDDCAENYWADDHLD